MAGEAPKPSAKVFHCPSCGAGVVIRAQGRSLSVVCGSCGSIIDPSNENYQILSKFQINAHIQPALPLGSRGTFRGDLWEIIGFMVRDSSGYKWREYLLHNPYKGFRWLTEFDGHWVFVTMIKDRPQASGDGRSVEYLGKRFKAFQSGTATVTYVLGEFYWRVAVGEQVPYTDAVCGAQMVSVEGDDSERVWSYGEHAEPKAIAEAFKPPHELPPQNGIGAVQPYPYNELISSLWPVGWLFVAALFILNFVTRHPIFWNFMVCSVLVLAPPLALLLHRNGFEQTRWQNGGDSE